MNFNKENKKNTGTGIPFTVAFCFLFVFFIVFSSAQTPGSPTSHQVTQVYIIAADSGLHDQDRLPNINILYGNVIFRHDSVFMYCDSAYLNQKDNNLEAFGNIRMEQGDTLFVYGDYLKYEGNIQLAVLRNNVQMINKNVTLFTDSFNYDRLANIGYFFDWGKIVDEENELESIYGQYSPATKEAFFNKEVKLTNSKFILTSDTLKYRTDTKIATILGPSVIESDSGIVYSQRGWYNTVTEESRLFDRSTVVSKDQSKTMTADSIYYNRTTGFAEAFGDMFLNDTAKNVILTGNYGYFDDLNKDAMATDSAQVIEYSQGDSIYLHADTLRMITIGENDREIKAYYGVRIYKSDLQGVCDSLQFNTADSLLYMYKDPILWNTGYQMTGDTICIQFNDSTVEKVNVINYAFATEEVDTTYFNQLKGKNLIASFTGGELSLIEVNGNAETIFYISEEAGPYIGMNRTISSYLKIEVENRKLGRTVLWPQPQASTKPIPDLTPEMKFLKGFIDFNYLRPKKKEDIFLKIERKESDVEELQQNRRQRRATNN